MHRKDMTEAQRKRRPCAACGKPVGAATIVAGGPYPDAPLCMQCGTTGTPEETFEMIKKRIASEAP
jgi:hypothetical protein